MPYMAGYVVTGPAGTEYTSQGWCSYYPWVIFDTIFSITA